MKQWTSQLLELQNLGIFEDIGNVFTEEEDEAPMEAIEDEDADEKEQDQEQEEPEETTMPSKMMLLLLWNQGEYFLT